jgi:hypothetical protein
MLMSVDKLEYANPNRPKFLCDKLLSNKHLIKLLIQIYNQLYFPTISKSERVLNFPNKIYMIDFIYKFIHNN